MNRREKRAAPGAPGRPSEHRSRALPGQNAHPNFFLNPPCPPRSSAPVGRATREIQHSSPLRGQNAPAIGDAFFVFRVCEFSTALHERRGEEVLALPASDFKIEWLREKRGEWIGEVLERRLCKRRGAEIDSGDSDSD